MNFTTLGMFCYIPCVPIVRLEYSLTVDELQESLVSVNANGKPIQRILNLALWAYLICAMLVLVFLDADHRKSDGAQNFWVTMAPPLASMLAVTVSRLVTYFSRLRDLKPGVLSGTAYGRLAREAITLALISPIAAVAIVILPRFAIFWHPSEAMQLIVGLLPWCSYFVGSQIIAAVRAPSRGRHHLKMFPCLARPTTVEISSNGIHQSDGVVDCHCGWAFFIRFRETPNLILLRTEQNTQLILPKRAVQSDESMQQLLALIQSHIAHGKFLPRESRFQVVQASAG